MTNWSWQLLGASRKFQFIFCSCRSNINTLKRRVLPLHGVLISAAYDRFVIGSCCCNHIDSPVLSPGLKHLHGTSLTRLDLPFIFFIGQKLWIAPGTQYFFWYHVCQGSKCTISDVKTLQTTDWSERPVTTTASSLCETRRPEQTQTQQSIIFVYYTCLIMSLDIKREMAEVSTICNGLFQNWLLLLSQMLMISSQQ